MSLAQAREISDVRELLELSNLADVTFYRLDAERLQDESSEPGAVGEDGDDIGEPPTFAIAERHGPEAMQVRCKLDWEVRGGRYTVDAAAEFTFDEALSLSPEVIREFVERVGIMAVYPYIREALHDVANKMRLTAPVLPLLRAGSVHVSETAPDQGATEDPSTPAGAHEQAD